MRKSRVWQMEFDSPGHPEELSDRPLGEWCCVTTDAGGRMTALALYAIVTSDVDTVGIGKGSGTRVGNQSTSPIPSALGSLNNLQRLAFSGNTRLSGPFPGSCTGIDELVHLDLENTQLCAPADASFQAWLQGI